MQGKAQTLEELVAQGISAPRARRILAARDDKQRMVDALLSDLDAVRGATGQTPFQAFSVSMPEIRRMKPKELKALHGRVLDRLAEVNGGERSVQITAVA